MTMIRLRLLGSLALTREDGSSVRSVLAQPKRFSLLAYLAASPSGAERPRDTLLGLFWPELDQAHARKALRQSLYGLRRSLGPGVLTGKGAELVGVDAERLWCDAAAFSAAMAEGRDEEALKLYGGPFLEGLHLSGAPEFERWVDGKRRRLETQATAAAWRSAEVAEGAGERAEARRWGERALSLAPYDGEGVRRYISLMERLGQPAAAVRAYEAYAARLAADLDLQPSPETVALVDRIRSQDAGPESASREAKGTGLDDPRPPSERLEAPVSSVGAGGDGAPDPVEEAGVAPARREDAHAEDRLVSRARNGGHRLATIAAGLALAALVAAGIAAFAVGGGSAEASPRIRSLAVLPLENLSGDPDQRYFTEGMTEALIAELGEIGALRVISRTSTRAYEGTEKRLPQIARELDVDGLIEGSVLKAGDEVRITVQLIHGPTDHHLWAESFERELRDVLALQGEVARSIARQIQVTLAPETEARLARAESVHPEAYEAYLKGRYRYARVSEEDHRAAISHYREALEHDSAFALAYASLAQVCVHPTVFRSVTSPAACRSWATRAVKLAPDLAEAHAALGHVRFGEWDWRGAETAFRRAIELNPNSVMARMGYSDLLWVTRRAEEAVPHIRRAEELDPLNLFVKTAVSWPLIIQGRFEEAVAQLDEVLEMNPEFRLPLWNQGEVFLEMEKAPEAREAARRLARLPGEHASFDAQGLRVGAHAVAGEEGRALQILRDLEARFGEGMPARMGLLHLRLGREEEALDRFERALRVRDPELILAVSVPTVDVLRDHPRFRALQRTMGLDAYASR